jgi:hypothetical protein
MAGSFEVDNRGVIVACKSCGKKNRLAYERLGETVQCGDCKSPLAGVNEPIELHSSAAAGRGRLLGTLVRPLPNGGT